MTFLTGIPGRILGPLGIIVAIAAVVFGFSAVRQRQQLAVELDELKRNPQQAAQSEVRQTTEEVGKLIALPEGEDPTLATITDKERLQDVPFFAKAENGDKVLIYVNARRAFLYRPSTKKIIEVATINLTPRADEGFAPTVALVNGTDVAGLTRRFEEDLKRVLPKVQVTLRGSAEKTDVAKTLVVDLTGSRKADAERLAAIIGATVSDLPEGEKKPTGADFLILLGEDKATASPTPSPGASPLPSPSPTPSPSSP